MFNRNMGNGLWALVKSLWFYGTKPDLNANKQKLQPTMQPMQNKMEELNPDHHTRPYSIYESNYPTTNTGHTPYLSQTAAGHTPPLSQQSKNPFQSYQTLTYTGQTKPLSQTTAAGYAPPMSPQQTENPFLWAPTPPQPVPAVPQVSNCSNCSLMLKQIDMLERRVDKLENKHDYQIRLQPNQITKPKYPDFSRFSSVNQKIPDVKAVPEVDEQLTPAEMTQLDIWFPNRVVPREALLVADCPIPTYQTDRVIGMMTRNECDRHDFQQIRSEAEEITKPLTKPKYPDFPRISSVQPVPSNLNQIPDNVPAAVPQFDDSLTPGEKALLRIWSPNPKEPFPIVDNHLPIKETDPHYASVIEPEPEYYPVSNDNFYQTTKMAEQIMTVLPDSPNQDKSHVPASFWINPLGQKIGLPLIPKLNQPTPNKLADNRLLMDNHFPIVNQTAPCDNKVIAMAAGTALPNSRPPTKWENPTFYDSNYNSNRMVEFQQQGQNIPTLAPPFVPNEIKPHQPAIWNPYENGITKSIPPAVLLEKPSAASNDDLTYQTKEIPDQQTAQNVPEERKSHLPPPDKYNNWKGSPLSMEFDQVTGNWVDRKKEMCGVNLGPGHNHQSQRKMRQLLQELATKNMENLEANRLAGLLSPAECKEKIEAVRVILSESAKIPSLEDPASTESPANTGAYGTTILLSQKDPLLVPPKLDDNRLMVDSHLPITKTDPGEKKVIELAPRTPLPTSRPPRIYENPAFFSARDNPYQKVKLQQPQHGEGMMELLPSSFVQEFHQQLPEVPSTIDTTPKLANSWWKALSKWLPAKKMKLPDDTNPVIIWDEQNGVWVDTSANKKEMCGVNPGQQYESQRKMQQLMLELAAKNTAKIESDILAGLLSQAECKEKIKAVQVILSKAEKIPLLVDPASTEGAMVVAIFQSMRRIQHWIH
ncbi:hypothetical protein DAPPUDRAFT_313458 [Daphnia pulex]|uniref:Uncharacterized protein n=1 Tax=Daphnia pulex TaxID=6669 RepID=E9G371_DAPPU|nr:hypothetical protein DAPPUDRAFT_313458 [Daphnia pulex]|eukprot:EFX86040.1 hypothetical protein DAPPUDRAFT_313458 [Daphnia pulex]